MERRSDKTTSEKQTAIERQIEAERLFMENVVEAVAMAKGFKVKASAPDSIEANRPDQAARVLIAEKAARRVVSTGKKILSGELGINEARALLEAQKAFRVAVTAVYSVETLAWNELFWKLKTAKDDPKIEFNQEVVRFIDSMIALIAPASGHWDFERVFAPLETRLKSEHASRAAKKKNAAPRSWVQREWGDRTDRGQSKASFARQYAPLVKKRFDLDVTQETIKRDWLPKG